MGKGRRANIPFRHCRLQSVYTYLFFHLFEGDFHEQEEEHSIGYRVHVSGYRLHAGSRASQHLLGSWFGGDVRFLDLRRGISVSRVR